MAHRTKPRLEIEPRIFMVRGRNVMLDADLAALYGVETKALNRAVRRNPSRFPNDFMFQLTLEEVLTLRCQIGTSNERGGRRYLPYAFTEQGVAMLSGVLHSPRAVKVNLAIMRAFVRLRGVVAEYKTLATRVDDLENKFDRRFKVVFDALRGLLSVSAARAPRRIGFHRDA